MLKLIKMDLYRLFSSKFIKVGAIMAALVAVLYMLLSLGIVALTKMALREDPSVAEGLGTFFSQATWYFGVDFAEIVFQGTSTTALCLFIGCMIAANFIGSEQSCGYTKNFAGQLPNRGYMAISKFISTSVAQVLIFVIYIIISALCAKLMFGKYITGYAIPSLFAALGLRLMLHLAINAIIIFLCTLTKSHAIAMVAGCIFGLGITHLAYLAIGMILSTLKINFGIANYMPDGINSLLLGLHNSTEVVVKTIIVSLSFIAVFLTANYLISKKRDVR